MLVNPRAVTLFGPKGAKMVNLYCRCFQDAASAGLCSRNASGQPAFAGSL